MRRLWDIFHLAQTEAPATSAASHWQAALLGPEICENPAVTRERQQLLHGLLAGEPAATALVGLLLVFRAATAEKMPTLRRDLRDAYDRWQPSGGKRLGELEEFLDVRLSKIHRAEINSKTIDLVWENGILRILGKE